MSQTSAARDVERSALRAEDGVVLRAEHRRSQGIESATCFVVVHGFTGSHESRAIRQVTSILCQEAGVVAVSMRGHGHSGGLSTLGDREVLDVDAAVRWAASLGYQHLVTVGFSMGASAVVRHAALREPPHAVVAVSGPSRWYYRGTPSMRRLHGLVDRPAGRAAVRIARRTRVTPRPWTTPYPIEPREAAGDMAVPLLVVHGDRDPYFPLDHAFQLEAAGPHVELWVEDGFGHAENAIGDELVRRIARWSVNTRDVPHVESQPVESQPLESQPVESQPVESQP